MDFNDYCQCFFDKSKKHLFELSEKELKFLNQIEESSIIFDYEIIDKCLADYILMKGDKIFKAQDDDDSFTSEAYLENVKNKANKEFNFVTRTIQSVQSKISTYSLIFAYSINNSENKDSDSINKRISENYKQMESNLKTSNLNLEKAQASLDETHKNIENMIPNVLTVVSILVSIIVAVFIVYITIFLDPKFDNPYKNILQIQMGRYVLSGHLTGDIIFLLLFMIATLTNRSILTTCNEHEMIKTFEPEGKDRYAPESFKHSCRNCQKKCSSRRKFLLRAAYIIYFNALMIFMYVFLYLWWVIENHWYKGFSAFLHTPDFLIISIAIGISIISVFIAFCKKYCKKQKELTQKQST